VVTLSVFLMPPFVHYIRLLLSGTLFRNPKPSDLNHRPYIQHPESGTIRNLKPKRLHPNA